MLVGAIRGSCATCLSAGRGILIELESESNQHIRMQVASVGAVFKVLSSDNLIYGPIDSATLVQWVQERRVQRDTWVHVETDNNWVAAGSISALQPEFDALPDVAEIAPSTEVDSQAIRLEELRDFKRFAPYSNEDLELLITFSELVTAAKGDVIIRKGEMSDSMFLVLAGQVRARLRVGGRDTSLGTMGPGELFGEVAMLSQTARSADVVAEAPTRLLRLTSERFQELMANHSQLAARMLFNIARLLATRMSQRNDELQKDLASSFVWR
jgi:CRP/FNR family cyclic AMP-dependent transcriptional regulator